VNGHRTGYGTLWEKDGSKFQGEWKDGKHNGKGFHYESETGTVYENDTWINGEPNGYGRFITSNGDYFEGQFADGQRHGKGKLITAKGQAIEAVWDKGVRNDKTIKRLPPAKSDWKPPDTFMIAKPFSQSDIINRKHLPEPPPRRYCIVIFLMKS